MQHLDKTIQLKPEEEVLEIGHEDLFPRLPRFFLLFLWFVVPFFFLFPLFREGWVGVVVFFLLAGSAALVFLRTYVRWNHTVFVVTDRRVIDVERRGFFDRVVSEVSYGNIDDVTYRVKGFFPTLFRYGDIRLHISGSGADIEFHRVPRPSRVHDLINDLRAQAHPGVRTRTEAELDRLAKEMRPEEIRAVASEMRRRERDEAVETLYSDDHA